MLLTCFCKQMFLHFMQPTHSFLTGIQFPGRTFDMFSHLLRRHQNVITKITPILSLSLGGSSILPMAIYSWGAINKLEYIWIRTFTSWQLKPLSELVSCCHYVWNPVTLLYRQNANKATSTSFQIAIKESPLHFWAPLRITPATLLLLSGSKQMLLGLHSAYVTKQQIFSQY